MTLLHSVTIDDVEERGRFGWETWSVPNAALTLVCPNCHAPMRIIAFITDAGTVRKILDHLGESTQPPTIAPARNDPGWDMSAQPVPEFEFDQRIAW